MISTFDIDLQWTNEKSESYLCNFYLKYSRDGRYVHVDKSQCSTLLQKRLAIDTIAQSKNGGSICVEEKIERWPGFRRNTFALETESCTVEGKEQPGWMRYAKADYLLYAFEQEHGDLDAYFLDFPVLKCWFWTVYVNYPEHTMNTSNRTRFRSVSISDVLRSVKATRYRITKDACEMVLLRGAA